MRAYLPVIDDQGLLIRLSSGLLWRLGFANCRILLSSVWVRRSTASLPINHLASILTSYTVSTRYSRFYSPLYNRLDNRLILTPR